MGRLDGRTCVVTGAGSGLGREYALLLAAEGAAVVVNDLGTTVKGVGQDSGPANRTVEDIRASGGRAVANSESVADWEAARRIIAQALDEFGGLDVIVNNAGVTCDREITDMSREDFERIMSTHLTGHFALMKAGADYWRKRHEDGQPVQGSIINTASGIMLGVPGMSDYGAAKAGIAAATLSVAMELAKYDVRVNCIAPIARSRLARAETVPLLAPPSDPREFDSNDPANVAPLVAYLASASCSVSGAVFHATGNEVGLFRGWTLERDKVMYSDGRWTIDALAVRLPDLVGAAPLPSMRTTMRDTLALKFRSPKA